MMTTMTTPADEPRAPSPTPPAAEVAKDASRRRAILLVAALAASVATAGIATIPFYTRGEPREALVVREMVEGNGWVLPLRNGTEIPRKPPFFHWLAAAVSLATGRIDEVTMRLPSALASVAAVVLVASWAAAHGGPSRGIRTALVTATSFEWMRAATLARVDMVYTTGLVAALVGLDRLLRSVGGSLAGSRLLLYGGLAAATLTKGPIALVLGLPATLILAGWCGAAGTWRRLWLGRGLAAVLVVVGGWGALAARQHGDAFVDIVLRENVHHLIATDAGGTGHAHGPLYLVGVTLLGLLPWTPLLPLALTAVRQRPRDDRATIVAAVWVVLVVGLHLFASAKRAVYVLPAYPALAFLIVTGAERASAVQAARFVPRVARLYAAVGVAAAACLVSLAWGLEVPATIRQLLRPRDRLGLAAASSAAADNAVLLTAAAAGIVVAMPFVLRAARRVRLTELFGTIAAVAAGAAVIFNTAIHPALARDRSYGDFMREVAAVVRPDQPLYFVGGAEPGAVFYAGRRIASLTRGDPPPGEGYFLLWERDWLEIGAGGRLPLPLKVSAGKLPRRGHLLLVAAPLDPNPPGGSQPSGATIGAGGRGESRDSLDGPELRSGHPTAAAP